MEIFELTKKVKGIIYLHEISMLKYFHYSWGELLNNIDAMPCKIILHSFQKFTVQNLTLIYRIFALKSCLLFVM
jgi:hypothetical protein